MMVKLEGMPIGEQQNFTNNKFYLTQSFAKHLQLFHPEQVRDPSAFKIKVESIHSKCLERQVKEGVFITNSNAEYVINSKSEYHQPSVRRVVKTREVRNQGL